MTPSPRKLRRGDQLDNEDLDDDVPKERQSILKNRNKVNSFEKDALNRKKSIAEEEQKFPRAVKVLKNGFLFLKYGKYGHPHERLVYLSDDEKMIEWKDANQKKCTGSIPLDSIQDIAEGRSQGHFHRFKVKDMNQDKLSFSIISSRRTLDLEASIKENKLRFIESLRILIQKK